MTSRPLPNYKNPPVDEVVFGATFESLHEFKTPYIGRFWDRIQNEFPRCEQVPPIGNVDELLEPSLGLPTPRVWLINEADDHLIQIQKNRFFFNWRKRKGVYPHFGPVYDGFIQNFNSFKAFIDEYELGDINIKGYELTYINKIFQDKSWDDFRDIKNILPDLSWRKSIDRFLNLNSDSVAWKTSFPIKDISGSLLLSATSAVRNSDGHPLIRLEITVRGPSPGSSDATMNKWFETAHEWIVRSFEDITDDKLQNEIWGKHATT